MFALCLEQVTNEMRDITFTADGKKPLVKWTLGKDKPV